MSKFDIKVAGNIIGGRQGWAYICNSNKYQVIKVNLDKEQEYESYQRFDDVRVITNRGGRELLTTARLVRDAGKFKLTSWGTCISSSFGFEDAMELVEGANMPKVHEGEIVALALYSKDMKAIVLQLYKIGKTDIFCQTVARLNELTDDEMAEVAKEADNWCRR